MLLKSTVEEKKGGGGIFCVRLNELVYIRSSNYPGE